MKPGTIESGNSCRPQSLQGMVVNTIFNDCILQNLYSGEIKFIQAKTLETFRTFMDFFFYAPWNEGSSSNIVSPWFYRLFFPLSS